MKVESVSIASLKPDPKNVRHHDARNITVIKGSLQKFGQQKPIVVDADNVVRAGNGTLEAAKALGWTKINIVRTALTGAQAAAYSVADNRSGDPEVGSTWDDDGLAKLLTELQAQDVELVKIAGFEDKELAQILAQAAGPVVEDEAPLVPANPITKPGDLWLLGQHRLLCGDSTKAEDVARVMDGQRAGLMNTDPPYGVGYANDERPNPGVAKPRVAKPRVANDVLFDERLQAFLESAFRAAVDSALLESAAWYMWHAHLTQGYFAAAAAAAANVVLHRQIIWVKPVLLLGRGQYHWKHEPCFMGWVQGHQPPDYGEGKGERTQTTVWEIGSVSQADRKDFNHSTPKPIALFTIPIIKHLLPGEICYEPFAGSGPQFIAAEQLGRRCYGLEISPAYCDVIVKRWEKFTGKKATREAVGKPTRKAQAVA